MATAIRKQGRTEGNSSAEITAAFWAAMVGQATNGHKDVRPIAARDVLANFADIVEQTQMLSEPAKHWTGPIPWPGAEYLAAAFRRILKGTDPTEALNLVAPSRGRHRGAVTTHNMEALAASFFFLLRRGWRAEKINAELTEAIGADRATIYRARKGFLAFGNPKFDEETLKVSMKPYAAKVLRILKRRKN